MRAVKPCPLLGRKGACQEAAVFLQKGPPITQNTPNKERQITPAELGQVPMEELSSVCCTYSVLASAFSILNVSIGLHIF